MMKLSEIRTAYEELSGKLSDINRQLCFSGFAVIWIFNKSSTSLSFPDELYMPSFLICLSLLLDVLQYVISTLCWYLYYLCKRHKLDKNDSEIEVDEPEWFNIIPWLLFIGKIALLIAAYFLIGKYLYLLTYKS